MVKDKSGDEKYSIDGKFNKELFVTDLKSGKSWSIFKAPQKPADDMKMFGMNTFSL